MILSLSNKQWWTLTGIVESEIERLCDEQAAAFKQEETEEVIALRALIDTDLREAKELLNALTNDD